MLTPLLTALVALARAIPVATLIIDNFDSSVLYSGPWVNDPIADSQHLNYDATLAYTNKSGAQATLTFSGAIGVNVYGSFPVAGTFILQSRYSVDGTNTTMYQPPGTITKPVYRQRFFQSQPLSPGSHTLVIANLGTSFYLDYIDLIMAPTPAASSSIRPPPSSSATASASQTQAPESSQGATSTALPESPPAASPSQGTSPSSESQSQALADSIALTSSTPSGGTSSSSTVLGTSSTVDVSTTSSATIVDATTSATRQRSHGLPLGAYIGIGVGGLVVLLCLIGGACLWHRRRKRSPSKPQDVSPFDPRWTSLASESEKRVLSQSSGSSSVGHGTTRRVAGVGDEGWSPLTSSPQTATPSTPPAKWRLRKDIPEANRRRSVDGGVRIAGGPTRLEASDLNDVEVRSAASTLPPLYQPYGSS
ncbi:hypothetical protein C8Q74DRAFT_1370534 [Fomes fomentarius]|nr:hypothetical protein C8Q74DRAFT_1370534 [Fomes fomentarius]